MPAEIILDYRQRNYAYWLFTLPDGHLTKDIYPISLRVSDGSTKLSELLENDDIWSLNQKVKTYGQCLAYQLSIGFSINLAKGVEAIIHEKSAKFLKKIIIQEVKKAIEEA